MNNTDNTENPNVSLNEDKMLIRFLEFQKLYMHKLEWQWHSEINIIIVNHGDLKLYTSEAHQVLHAGEGVIINSGTIHSVEPCDSEANASIYLLSFSPDLIFGENDISLREKYMSPVITSKSFQYYYLRDDDPLGNELLENINLIIADNLIKRFGYELSTKSRLCAFWLMLLEAINPKEDTRKSISSSADDKRTKEMITYMEAHYSEKITLEDLSTHTGISRSECCRCFKRELGITPVEYLMKYRIAQSIKLIKENSPITKSFSALATAVGFNNASYFNKVFREYMSCTPSEYKKNIADYISFDPFSNSPK